MERGQMSAKAASIVAELRDAHPSRSVDIDIKGDSYRICGPWAHRGLTSNLLCNAWKVHRKTEDSRIELETVELEGKIIYYVRDNGAGFDQQICRKDVLALSQTSFRSGVEAPG